MNALLSRLENVHSTATGCTARCPAHEDRKNSLKIDTGNDGKVLLHCFAGCSNDAILDALGLTWRELNDPVDRWTPVTCSGKTHAETRNRQTESVSDSKEVWEKIPGTRQEEVAYDYTDESGQLLSQAVRYSLTEREKHSGKKRPGKDFEQRRPNGRGGWIKNLKETRRVLYHLPEVVAAVQRGEIIYLVEGEKDVENLRALGLAATCNAMGAGKWEPGYTESLRGAHVVILPDNDEPGRKHRDLVGSRLLGVAAEVRVLDLPGLLEKGADVSDWLAAGGTREELLALVAAAPLWEPSKDQAQEYTRPWISREIERLHEFAEVHPSGLRFPHELSQRQYEEIGRRLLHARTACIYWFNFAAGDWYNAQRTDYGYRKEWCDALFGKGMSAQIRSLAVVARAWPLEKRDPKIPWTFYRITAADRWAEHRAEWMRQYMTREITIELIQETQKEIREKEEAVKRTQFDAENFELVPEPVTLVEMSAKDQNVCGANVSYAVEEWEEFCEIISPDTRNLLAAVVQLRGEQFVRGLLQGAIAEEIAAADQAESESPAALQNVCAANVSVSDDSPYKDSIRNRAGQNVCGANVVSPIIPPIETPDYCPGDQAEPAQTEAKASLSPDPEAVLQTIADIGAPVSAGDLAAILPSSLPAVHSVLVDLVRAGRIEEDHTIPSCTRYVMRFGQIGQNRGSPAPGALASRSGGDP